MGLILSAAMAWAQLPVDGPRTEFGLLGGVNFNIHKGNFTQLGEYASCCPEFRTGTGIGSNLGVFATIPLAREWRLMGRFVYANESGSFISNEDSFVADLGDSAKVVPAVFSHELAPSLTSFGIEPLLAYRAANGLDVLGGIRIALVSSSNFMQTETLAEPEDFGTYVGTDRTWVNHDAPIPDALATRFTAALGLRYIVPLTESRSLFMAPEAFFHFPLTNVASGVDWRVSEIRFGVEIGWAPVSQADGPAPVPPAPAPQPTVPPTTIASVWIDGIGPDGTTIELDSIRVEETRVVDLLPVLGHVYFDQGSASIPDRYVQGARRSPAQMTTPEQAMQGVLSIIADRMKTSKGQLTIIGSTSATPQDRGTALARRRAVAVRDQLVALGVPADRLRVQARNLPAMPTRSSHPDDGILAEQENRRVELVPSDPDLLMPVTLASVRRSITPEQAIVRTSVTSYPGVASASLRIRTAETSVESTSKDGIFAEGVAIPAFMGMRPSPLRATLTVTDSLGKTVIERDSIPVSLLTVERKRAERREDTEIERYSLILFAFNDASVTPEHERVLERIRERIRQGASVRIVGMTDSMGSSEYNRDLSRRRALSVAKALGLPESTIQAMGSTAPRFPNASPEGRAYNRTVVIEITTTVR